jgi:hypothetical protein
VQVVIDVVSTSVKTFEAYKEAEMSLADYPRPVRKTPRSMARKITSCHNFESVEKV